MTVKADYDREAANYDQSRFTDDLGSHLDLMHKKIIYDFIGKSDKKLLLEAGVGTGRFATWLAKKGHNVIGIDISKGMLKKAKEKATRLGVTVDLIRADITSMPFQKAVFDVCFSINVLDHLSISNISKFFDGSRYVIEPNGFLVFNFSNIQSPYLPIAFLVNSRNQALFKKEKIFSIWSTLKEIDILLLKAGFNTKKIKGVMIASPLPFIGKATNIISSIDFAFEDSLLKVFCGTLFVKTGSTHLDTTISNSTK
jgi:ubiquinone/menaquinone biosynthesis C-methylase UbiE